MTWGTYAEQTPPFPGEPYGSLTNPAHAGAPSHTASRMSDPSPTLEARRARVARIRRRVIGGASGLFLLSTGAIVVQLVTGHDPALASAAAAKAAASRAVTSSSRSALPDGPRGRSGYGPPRGWDRHRGEGWYGGGGGGPYGGGGGSCGGGGAPGGGVPGGGSADQPPSSPPSGVAPLTTHQS